LADSRNDTQRCDNKRSNEIHIISKKEETKKSLREEWERISLEYVNGTVRIHSILSKISDSKGSIANSFLKMYGVMKD
jgi:hypothetical protein